MNERNKKITLSPEVLRWARERIDCQPDELARKMSVKSERVQAWEENGQISIAQVDKLAHKTFTPLGLLYLSEPPEDLYRLDIPDFRRRDPHGREHPSPDLVETIHTMQGRQAWMREELLQDEIDPLPFVGSADIEQSPAEVAQAMKTALGLEGNWAARESSWQDALRSLRNTIDRAGILIMMNGVVGNNNHRKLSPEEFQGFAIADKYAPLIFVNGADYVSAQMFTLGHELAHIFVGATGISNFDIPFHDTEDATEKFCNQVAAEFLVPGDELNELLGRLSAASEQHNIVARHFKVSTIVAARRMLDLGFIDLDSFFDFYNLWKKGEHDEKRNKKPGGHFWNTQHVRIGHRFGAAIARAVGEDRLFYREAYRLTGLRGRTFDKYMREISE